METDDALAGARDSRQLKLLVILLAGFGAISTTLFLPSLPAIQEELGASVNQTQLTLSVFFYGFAVSQLIVGPLADRFGRRKVALGGCALYALAGLACAVAPDIETLVAARLVQSMGACTGAVISRAIVRDLYGREEGARMMARLTMIMALTPGIAPILGGQIEVWLGWRFAFVFMTLFGGGLCLWLWTGLIETNRQPDRTALRPLSLLRNYGRLLRDPVYLGFALCTACIFSGQFAFLSGSSFVLIELFGIAPDSFGYYYFVVVVSYSLGALVAPPVTKRLGIERSVLSGVLFTVASGLALGGLALGRVDLVLAVVVPMLCFEIGFGILHPNSVAGALAAFPQMAGTASALMGFLQMSVAATAGLAVSGFHDGTQRPLALTVAALGCLAFAGFFALTWPRRAESARSGSARSGSARTGDG